MAFTQEDLEQIKELIKAETDSFAFVEKIENHLQSKFVTRHDCEKGMRSANTRIDELKIDMTEIQIQLKFILWILCAVGGGIIALVIKQFWG